ncbi:hypothetical protein [Lactobacillus hominis]|uniref:hypothetical protein n=1 Tax=Lactobacillus hominis TaxID=1203033 RepID=UPI0002E1895A|nr:hypothetical protein [Lactobacillus hominis]KRM84421.1 hypothetical protein FC41_GL000759 [Lactobacillus hominis DSM 23910 = CRBIP 24.179]
MKNTKKQITKTNQQNNTSQTSTSTEKQQIQQSKSTSSQVNTEKAQQTQTNQQNGQLPPASSLSDFLNKYGVSPALYLEEHAGMDSKQALESVPDNMKSSGELQTQRLLEQENN